MRVRHRTPSIFNLSMVDVLCCALGCVILLWLLNLKEADEHQRDQGAILTQLDAAMQAATSDARGLRVRLADLENARLALKGELNSQTATALDLDKKLKEALARILAVQKDLDLSTKKGKDETLKADDLAKRLVEALKRIEALQVVAARLPEMKKEIDKRDLDLSKLDKLMQQLLAAKVRLEKDVDAKDKELTLALVYKDKLQKQEGRMLALTKELAEGKKLMVASNQAVEALLEEKKGIQARALRLQAEVDNRFAGIALTGRRVAFVVDMSGSMERVDSSTLAPNKWTEVRNTIVRVMRSLQNLEKFQVILFANEVRHPLGFAGQWLDYNPKSSAEQVSAALAEVKPEGGTNMFLGLEAAFGLRNQGLDTIYFMSDGLPNNGPGLTADQSARLKGRTNDVERGVLLGRHIRQVLKNDWNAGGKVKINSVGFYYESPDLGSFLWALSRENGGSFVGMSSP